MIKESYIDKIKLINNSFKSKNFYPLYFIYGVEDFYILNIKKSAIINFEDTLKANTRIYDKSNFEINEVIKYLDNMPMMNDKKLVIFENIDYFKNKKNKTDKKNSKDNNSSILIETIEKNKDINIIIILNYETDDGYNKYYTSNEYVDYFAKNGIVLNVTKLNEKDLQNMVESRFKKNKVNIDKFNISYLISICGDDLSNLNNEIDKLSTYVGKNNTVKKDDIDVIVTKSLSNSVFTLFELYNEKKQDKAIEFYGNLLSDGSYNPNAIFASFASQISNLIVCKDLVEKNKASSEIAQIMNLPLWRINKLITACKYTNIENLKLKLKEITKLSVNKVHGNINDDYMLILLMDKV